VCDFFTDGISILQGIYNIGHAGSSLLLEGYHITNRKIHLI
jgi:hypothetical protein